MVNKLKSFLVVWDIFNKVKDKVNKRDKIFKEIFSKVDPKFSNVEDTVKHI